MNEKAFKMAAAVAKRTEDTEASNHLNALLAEVSGQAEVIAALQEEIKELKELVTLPPAEPEWPDQRKKVQKLEEGIRMVLRNPTVLNPMTTMHLRQALEP